MNIDGGWRDETCRTGWPWNLIDDERMARAVRRHAEAAWPLLRVQRRRTEAQLRWRDQRTARRNRRGSVG